MPQRSELFIEVSYFTRSSMLEAHQAVNYTTRTPLGVAGLITPWNLPLYLLTWKVICNSCSPNNF